MESNAAVLPTTRFYTFQVEDHWELHCLIATCSWTQHIFSHQLLVHRDLKQNAPDSRRNLSWNCGAQIPQAGNLRREPTLPTSASGSSGSALAEAVCRGRKEWDTLGGAGAPRADAMALPGPVNRYLLLMAQEHLEFRLPVSAAVTSTSFFWRGRRGGDWCASGGDPRSPSPRAVGGLCLSGRSRVRPVPRPLGLVWALRRVWERSPRQPLSLAKHFHSFFSPCARYRSQAGEYYRSSPSWSSSSRE